MNASIPRIYVPGTAVAALLLARRGLLDAPVQILQPADDFNERIERVRDRIADQFDELNQRLLVLDERANRRVDNDRRIIAASIEVSRIEYPPEVSA